jgi:O-antigen/teichoic acid export membrane protein
MYFTRALENPTVVLGKFQLFETAISLLLLITGSGLGLAVVKRVSEDREIEEILGATALITGAILILVTAFAAIASNWIAAYFGVGLVVVGLFVVIVWAKQIATITISILKGASNVGRSGLVDFTEMLIRIISQVILIILGLEFVGLVGGAAIGSLAAALIGLRLSPFGVSKPRKVHFKRLLEFTQYTFFQGLAERVYANVDTIVIAAFLGNSAIALYNIPYRLTLALDVFSSSIHSSTLPEISTEASNGNTERVRVLLKDAMIFSTILAIPATVGVLLLAEQIIVTLFTDALAAGTTVAIIAVAIQIPDGLRSVFSSTLLGVDRPDLTLRSNLLLITINIVLDLLLVPTIGIEGAAIATLIAVLASTTYLGNYAFRELGLSRSVFPLRAMGSQTIAAILMGGVVHFLQSSLTIHPIINLIVFILAGVIVYWVVLLTISASTRRRIYGIAADVLPLWLLELIPEPQESD